MYIIELSGIMVDIEGYRNIRSSQVENGNIKMAEEPASKKKKYLVKFKDSWPSKFSYIRKSSKGDNFAHCTVCRSDFSVGHGGENDITRHNATPKHKECVESSVKQTKLTDWGASSATSDLDQNVTKAELLFPGFLVEHMHISM